MFDWPGFMASFPEVMQSPHFDKLSFRVGKKIWATWDASLERLCVPLEKSEQDVFSRVSKGKVYAVPNTWGEKGWTYVETQGIEPDLCKDLLWEALKKTATKKYLQQHQIVLAQILSASL